MIAPVLSEFQQLNISPQPSTLVKSRHEKRRLKIRVLKQLYRVTLKKSGSPLKAIWLIRQIRKKYQSAIGEPMLTKAAKVDNRYYWRLGAPGFPSKASLKMHENEVNRFFPLQTNKGLRTVFLAITKKCPLKCEHCFEWNNLNQEDKLTTSDIIQIVHKYQDIGTTQIMFSGGEPMLRVNDICEIIVASMKDTDFWIFTSGLGLNMERARQLKKAGLTGVLVSLDHYEASKHNLFRGSENAYNMAIQAVVNSNKAGLVTTLSLCAIKDFVNEDNLAAYMNLAKTLGVSFVQIIEPRAKGRYFGKDIELGKEKINLLEKFYLKYNSSIVFKDYPIINYLGYHQRRLGCFGGGNRFFYIDTDGDAHICPYCSKKVGNTLDYSAEKIIDLLAQHPCHVFNVNNVF